MDGSGLDGWSSGAEQGQDQKRNPEKGKASLGMWGLSFCPAAYRLSKWLKSKRLNSRLSSAW